MLLAVLSVQQQLAAIKISRVSADSNILFPSNSQRLTRFMMDATYGPCRAFSPAWAQRAVLDATADADFFARLQHYEQARANGAPCGAILVAEDDSSGDNTLCGFADVGASLWLPNDKTFRLPQDEDLQQLKVTGLGTSGRREAGVAVLPYVSNLVVDASRRRSGVGRQLMEACEAEVMSWADGTTRGCASDDANAAAASSAEQRYVWLEVSAANERGLAFYGALDYTAVDESISRWIPPMTRGDEVVREGGGFQMAQVERKVLCKAL
jgi:ribosomal protein S18 acetylase RimI-like enzyme